MKIDFVVTKCYCWFCRIMKHKDELIKVDEIESTYFNSEKWFDSNIYACKECKAKYHLANWNKVFDDETDWLATIDEF